MKEPLRVAVIGRLDHRVEVLLAGVPPSVQLRCFPDGAALGASNPPFSPELVALLPGVANTPELHSVPVWRLEPGDLHGPASALEAQFQTRSADHHPRPQARLLGHSPAMARVRGFLSKTAASHHPLLLTGENGTGKDLAAVVAHELSCRASEAFVPVNCGAIPTGLAETEFFGCVRGAFTGAENRTGFCQQALGGTLFLDEVGEMPPEIQSKLLRVLESQEIRRVGSSRVETTDFRLICATNRDLAAEVRAGRFREDLYYRINVLSLRLPALRDRKEDLPLLADHFLEGETRYRAPRTRMSAQALSKMHGYHWPGNLRQLRNVVLRAAVLYDGQELRPEHVEWDS